MQRIILGLLASAALAAHAHADGAEDKSPLLAVSLSIGVTAAGASALFVDHAGVRVTGVFALLLGPSAGRWYAGDGSLAGLGLRVLGGATALAGAALEAQRACDDDSTSCSVDGGAVALVVTGAGLWIGSTVVDTVLAHRSARRWNERHAVTVSPTAFATGSGTSTGLVVTGRF